MQSNLLIVGSMLRLTALHLQSSRLKRGLWSKVLGRRTPDQGRTVKAASTMRDFCIQSPKYPTFTPYNYTNMHTERGDCVRIEPARHLLQRIIK